MDNDCGCLKINLKIYKVEQIAEGVKFKKKYVLQSS